MSSESYPNQASCLLNQKLQMLAACIRAKRIREQSSSASSEPTTANSVRESSPKSNDSDSDEFFDAEEETDQTKSGEEKSDPAVKPEGLLEAFENLTLLKYPDRLLYVPITQEPAPMTEDMLQEQTEIMCQLGTTSEGAALRIRMQSAGLLSDMESFKAANPGCELADFVRWYSPRDYEPEQPNGLSVRMQGTWTDLWNQARAVPIHRQKRLFDYTKEAEKVLHYLASFTLDDITRSLMPVLIHSASAQLQRERDVNCEFTDTELPIRIADIARSSVNGNYLASLHIIRETEIKIVQCLSLKHKLNTVHKLDNPDIPLDWLLIKKFVLNLTTRAESEVSGAAVEFVKSMFRHSQRIAYEEQTPIGERDPDYLAGKSPLGTPFAREFILRTMAERPATGHSRPTPQRLYACVAPNEFRLAGSWCQDAVYF